MPVKLGNNNLTFSGISEIYVGSNKVYSATPPGPPIIDNPVNEYFCVYSAKSFTIRFEKIQTAGGANANLNYDNLKLKYSTNKTNWTEVSATQGFNFNGGTLYYIYTSSAEVGTFVHEASLSWSSAAWGQVCSAPAYGYYSYTSTRMKFSGTSTIYLMGNIRTIAQGDQATPYNGYVGSKTMIDYVGMTVSSSSYSIYYTRACGLGASTRGSTYLRARGISNIQGTSNSIIDISNLFIGNHENTGTGEVSYPTFSYSTGTPYTPPYDPSEDYFYVENLTNSSNTLTIKETVPSGASGLPSLTVYRSTDKTTWTSMGNTSIAGITYSIPANSKVYLKATADRWAHTSSSSYRTISCSSNFAIGGNIMSLLKGDSFIGQTTLTGNKTFNSLFYNITTLKNIDNLVLPATTLTERCYSFMFSGCSRLTNVPNLPATTLADKCYYCMFQSCTGLTTIPSNLLPATTLADSCYYSMFNICTGLTTIPEDLLPATTLVISCYSNMFSGCTGLTNVPNLPATTLADYCYSMMFSGCTGITSIPSNFLPATTLTDYCYQYMLRGTSITSVPSTLLPATTLNNYCYQYMFLNCRGLTKSPELPATTLTEKCYYGMFKNCSSLNEITCYADDISATDCTTNWVSGVAATGTFYQKGNASWSTGVNGIPTGWTIVDDRPYSPINDYFWVENITDSAITINLYPTVAYANSSGIDPYFYDQSDSPSVQWSTDKITWTNASKVNSKRYFSVPAKTRYYLRNTSGTSKGSTYYYSGNPGSSTISIIQYGWGAFFYNSYSFYFETKMSTLFSPSVAHSIKVGGNIRTILGYGDSGVNSTAALSYTRSYYNKGNSYVSERYWAGLGKQTTTGGTSTSASGLYFSGIKDASQLYIGSTDVRPDFINTPSDFVGPIYT